MLNILRLSLAVAFLCSFSSFSTEYKTYDVFKDNKRSGIGVLIKSRMSKSEAYDLGGRLSLGKSEDYTVIFHLEGQPLKSDHWASFMKKKMRLEHYNNNPLRIMGTTKEQYEKILAPYKQAKERNIYGQWVDPRFEHQFVYTLYKQDGIMFLESGADKSNMSVSKVKFSRLKGGIKITDENFDDPNSLGEFMLFINKELQFWSPRGHFLTMAQTRLKIK